ncbi:MAG TPA: hypothetical protein VM915_03155 [Verrucomicrobiae bacterium]|nr:hypothetical protein [Verrucomicrobiae bacterium]
MILRRTREHVRAHNWFAVGIDLAIVVLGVFLGTQVSNWNAERLAHEAGDTYRARIVRDLETNRDDMQTRAAYYTQVKEFGLRVLGDLDGSQPVADEAFLIAAYQASQIYPRPMTRATYDEVLATGALNTLGDIDTRDRISNHYTHIETSETTFRNVPPYREIVRRAMPYRVQERIRSNCAEVLDFSGGAGLGRMALPSDCQLGLSAAEISRAAARVRATPGLELDTTRLLADLDQKLLQAGRAEERAVDLAEELTARR